jgi:hypothetical protein
VAVIHLRCATDNGRASAARILNYNLIIGLCVCSVFANRGALIIYNACSNRELGGLKSREDVYARRAHVLLYIYGLVCGRGEIINIGRCYFMYWGDVARMEKNNNQSQRVASLSCIIILCESKKSAPVGQMGKMARPNLISVA